MSIQLVGIYKVYKEIAGIIGRFGDPINQVIYPEFTKLLGRNDISRSANVAKKTIFLLTLFGFFVVLFLLLSSKFLITSLFGFEYLSSINALYTMIVLFGFGFMFVPVNSLFIAAGFAQSSFIIVLCSNIIYLFVAFTFGKLIGIYGIIFAYGTQMDINQGTKLFLLKKYSSDWGAVIR
jgi:O-antigen/teichoic acid export membrane protein